MRIVLALAAFAASLCGQEPTPLEPGKPVERAISSGETHSYRIDAPAGQFVGVTIRQLGIDVAERLLAPDGKLVGEFDAEIRPDAKETATWVTEGAGAYRLEVAARLRGSKGRYEIQVTEARAASEHDHRLQEARVLSARADRLMVSEENEDAFPLASQALEIGERELGPEHPLVGYLLAQSGWLLFKKGEYTQAEALLRRALAISQGALGPEHHQSVQAMRLLGKFYAYRGDYTKGEPLLQRALDITGRTLGENHPEFARCLADIGDLHHFRRDYSRAEQELQRALAIVDKSLNADDPLVEHVLNELVVSYNSHNDFSHSEPLMQRDLEILERTSEPGSPRLALVLQNLGLVAYEKRKDYGRALELYWRAATLLEKSAGAENPKVARVLNNIGNVYIATGEYKKALDSHRQAHAIFESKLGPYNDVTLLSLGNIAKTYMASGDAANALQAQARTDEAIEKSLPLSLAIGSERQKLNYFDNFLERTSRTIWLQTGLASAVPSAPGAAALAVLQRKGRILDAMSGGFAALRQRLLPADQELLDDLSATTSRYAKLALNGLGSMPLADYQKQLAAFEESKDRLEAEVSRRSAEFRAQSQPVTLAAVQAVIPPGASLIEFAAYRQFNPRAETGREQYGELRYVVYVLRREGEVKWKELGRAEEIDHVVDAFRQALRDPRRKDVESLARAVDQRVMQPVRALTGDATVLLISPDGALNLVPFQALEDEQGRYLVERYSISYLTSGRDLLRMQSPRPSPSEPLVIADPFFGEPEMTPTLLAKGNRASSGSRASAPDGRKQRRSITIGKDLSSVYFAPLSGAGQEARAIQLRFPEARILSGRQATESALKQADAPRVLHIATHGFFLQDAAGARIENPLLRSGLALAGANLRARGADDGIFTALEASSLNLWGTKLVTLSACDTGVGEVKNGEGVYGLRRAFFLAGAESLVMSLWPVSDYMTREMMTTYYTGLKQGLGRGEALRQAQLAMLKRDGRRHPFYWASFIQSGDWKNLDGK